MEVLVAMLDALDNPWIATGALLMAFVVLAALFAMYRWVSAPVTPVSDAPLPRPRRFPAAPVPALPLARPAPLLGVGFLHDGIGKRFGWRG
jgi:hypothetical protein